MGDPARKQDHSDSELIDRKLTELKDWRGRAFKVVRELIKQADPQIVEELKWKKPSNPMGDPVYSHYGMICVGNVLKSSVRLTFFKGASLKDPSGLFNGGLDSNTRRWIDVHEGDMINGSALKNLIREAVALNSESKK
jgi:hypothetical protein